MSVAPREEQRHIEAFPGQAAAESARMQGLAAADDGPVVIVDLPVPVDIAVFRVAGLGRAAAHARQVGDAVLEHARIREIGVLVGSVIDESVHHARRLADLCDVGILAVELLVPGDAPEQGILSVRQGSDLVAVDADVGIDAPHQVPHPEHIHVQGKFQAPVLHRSDVQHLGRIARRGRDGRLQEQVIGVFLIDIARELDPVVEESEIHAQVPLGRRLPFQPVVGHIGGIVAGDALAAEHIVVRIVVARQGCNLRIEVVRR